MILEMSPGAVTVWLAAITALGSGFGGWIAYKTLQLHGKSDDIFDKTVHIEKSVNSERTAMIEEVKRLNTLVASIDPENVAELKKATVEMKQMLAELNEAVKTRLGNG